jgi:uncharacterized protein YutE (UPF0331/DUF86 family)
VTRGRPDRGVVRRHLLALGEARRNLERHAGASLAQLRKDRDLRWAVERGLQLCAQNALDVATHLAASSGLDAPDYATAIDRLVELSVLPAEFAARFRGVAGFRNVLVHGYLEVDLEILHRVLNQQLGDFAEFAGYVERHLERLPEA